MRVPRSQALGEIVLASLGVWNLVKAFNSLTMVATLYLDTGTAMGQWLWGQLAQMVLYLILGAGLVVLRSPLSALLFARDSDVEIDSLDAEKAEQVLITAIGLWLAAISLSEGIALEMQSVIAFEQNREALELEAGRGAALMSPEAWSNRLSYLPHLIIGIAIMLGAGSLSRFWTSLRAAGRTR